MRTTAHRSTQGFTLIELIVVLTVIGILAAIAFSKYINIQSQARTAKAQALFGTIRTSAALAKAACTLDIAGLTPSPTCTVSAGTVSMDGTSVAMIFLYPAATSAGIIAATQIDPTNDQVTVTAGNPIAIDINGSSGGTGTCTISYTAATSGNAPTITLTTTGC